MKKITKLDKCIVVATNILAIVTFLIFNLCGAKFAYLCNTVVPLSHWVLIFLLQIIMGFIIGVFLLFSIRVIKHEQIT